MGLVEWFYSSSGRKSRSVRAKRQKRREGFLRRIEQLEPRLVLDGCGPTDYGQVATCWLETTQLLGEVSSTLNPGSLSTASSLGSSSGQIDPQALVSRWIIRLTSGAAAQASSVSNVEPILRSGGLPYQVLYGLGLPGQVLVDIPGRTYQTVVDDLRQNPAVAQFEPDVAIIGPQSTPPTDDLFRNQTGLENDGTSGGTPGADISALNAWGVTHGSVQTVVGVIDSGLDYTHEDLYDNVWINQGEIPAAIKAQNPDKDSDGLITFRDLNDLRNAGLVVDANGNQRIDGYDLLQDHRWADNVDTDGNGYRDDLIGWNFQAKSNDPYDDYRHGTHVAGIIGAVGDNQQGVAGVAWDVSLMPLKFLDQYNRGLTSDAILAISYATLMHTTYGVNIRVTNNSWGRSGDFSPNLLDAIRANGNADMLFVTAAGNGNILGRGVDNDILPFYPASFDLPNIISVAASDYNDQLATFSNYGRTSVDLAAPGVGILSTEPRDATNPQGNYASRNGTSMAAPFVTGTAALLWSRLPDATADEVRQAILLNVDPVASLKNRVATGGRLNAALVLAADTYRPRVTLQAAADITEAGGDVQEISIAIHDNGAVKLTSLDGYDLVVTPVDRAGDPLNGVLKRTAPTSDAADVVGVYWINAPGGRWDPADNGVYQISLQANEIKDMQGNSALPKVLGQFRVHVPNIGQLTVDSTADAPDANLQDVRSDDGTGRSTLRSAVMQANATAGENTILLPMGTFVLTIPSVGGDSAASGDLDITDTSGKLTIIGAQQGGTILDAAGLDRVFHVFPGAQLDLQNVTIRGGQATTGEYGGGVLNAGGLSFTDSRVTGSHAVRGGGVYSTGPLTILRSTLDNNSASDTGGGLYNSAAALVPITNSTFTDNSAVTAGGAIYSSGQLQLRSDTVAGNSTAGQGGGISNTGTVTTRNTILAANRSTVADPDVHGVFTTLGNNLVGDVGSAAGFADGVIGDLIGSSSQSRDPVLGPLAEHGGLTPTRELLVGSPAINAGTFTDAPATDQRGAARPKSGQGKIDIGAFERNYVEIHGVKYHDANGNGVRDLGEPGLAGWTMYLDLNNNGKLDANEPSTVTSADSPATADIDETGQYAFTHLAPGSYAVREVPQDNFTQTFPRDLMFTATPALNVGRNPVALAAEDFNRDGFVDLVVANRDDNNLSLLLNQRGGLFEATATVSVGTAPAVVATGHLNDDSYPDLVVGNQGSNDLTLLWNDGHGAFPVQEAVAVGGQPLAVAVTDLNGDGLTDLAVVTANSTDVLVLLQDAQGRFTTTQRVAVGSSLSSLIAADLDGDRDRDLVVLSRADSSFRLLTNDGHGVFTVSNPIFSGGLSPSAVAAADLDGDGDFDLAIANQGSNAISVMLNQGNGTFGAAVNLSVGSAPISVAAADVDRNGSLDLVTLNQGDNTISVLINKRDTSHDLPGQGAGLTLTVNSTADKVDLVPGDGLVDTGTPGEVTLRAAIMEANASAGDDTINLPAGTYRLTISGAGENAAATGDLDITDAAGALSIRGAGPDATIIDAGGDSGIWDRVFEVRAGGLHLQCLSVKGGRANGSQFSDALGSGGGLLVDDGAFSLTDVKVLNNRANSSGGGIFFYSGAADNATITGSTISGNYAASHGGGLMTRRDTVIAGSLISNNEAGYYGGGINHSDGTTLQIADSSITGNTADDGGGISTTADLDIQRCVVSGNTASGNGGGLRVEYHAPSTTTVTIQDSTFSTNVADQGGGLYNMASTTVVGTTFSGNRATRTLSSGGGAILNDGVDNARLTLTNTTISANTSAYCGGGLLNSSGQVTIISSTLSGNQATNKGGALLNDVAGARSTISNSTLSGNSAPEGGAIANRGGQVEIVSTTIAANSATGTSAAAVWNQSGSVSVSNTIVAGTTAGKADVGGGFSSAGHNLIGNVGTATGFTHGSNGDLVGTSGGLINPQLGPLQDNGGPTFTHKPLAGSPVIDAGSSTSLTFDQRGAPRVWDGDSNGTATADIGSVEYFQGFFVDSFVDTVDANPGDGVVADATGKRTLRAAIMEANAKAGADTIVLAAGTYKLTISGSGEDAAARGDLDVTSSSLTIVGAGMGTTVIDAGGAFGIQDRVFHVPSAAATLRLEDLTVAGGISIAGSGVYVVGGELTLLQTEVTDNEGEYGGGISLSGTASITNSVISGNRSTHHGGGLYFSGGNATLANSTIADNTATLGGGGIFSYGTLTIAGSTIAG
ncbi:MAG: S8 family serine peptidase, partial [Planctomycetota bacterium]|nr:S8 family serine peptidase [Planctomycetota bacterium]